jgi:HSP20 family molecular chaperone IbpA
MNPEPRPIAIAVGLGRPSPEAGRRPAAPPEPHPDRQTPLIDIHEGPDGLVLEADLPGASDQSLKIELEDNVLSLHAKVPPSVPDNARIIHEEYRTGEFHRSFILSDEVDRARIAAELKNGVLRLTLPKAERAKTRRIEIKTPS